MSNFIEQCKAIVLPPLIGDQFYTVQTTHEGKKSAGATRESNAYTIINNCIRISGTTLDALFDKVNSTCGLLHDQEPPSIKVEAQTSNDYSYDQLKFSFTCGAFTVIADGPHDYNEVTAEKIPTELETGPCRST